MERIAGRYDIETMLGYGGMGEVYRAMDTVLNQHVAIKLLKPEIMEDTPDILERFEREGEALRRLNHPNIVKMLASVQENGKHYLIMEYVGGGNLQHLLRQEAQLPVQRMLEISLDLADALTRAHRLKIIHRDIKPANVLLAEDGTPRLTDFGVARIGDRTRMTQTGSLVGTYAYLSPEACRGESLDERADIWAFGIMMYEMLAGIRPFDSDQPAAIIFKIMSDPVPNLQDIRPDVPAELMRLIYEMLEKERDLRISSVREVGSRLEKLIRSLDDGEGLPQSRFTSPTPTNITPQRMPTANSVGFKSFLDKPLEPLPGDTAISESMITLQAARRRQSISLVVGILITLVVIAAVVFLTRPEERGKDGPPPPNEGAEITLVEPVADNEYMVLVADLERLEGETLPVARLLTQELAGTLENDVPFSNYRVRAYPHIITTPQQATTVAEANKAVIIVWGNYTSDGINLELQIGAMDAFENINTDIFPRDMLERTTNISVKLEDVQTESIAPMIIRMAQTLETVNGNTFGLIRNLVILDELAVTPAQIEGSGVAVQVQRFFEYYLDDTARAVQEIDEGIRLDAADNPILYSMRGIGNERIGESERARTDSETAQRLTGGQWVVPIIAMGNHAFYIENDLDQAIWEYSQAIDLQPNNWFFYTFRGVMYYLARDFGAARTDLDRAIELQPQSNWPYIYASLIALRDGRVTDGQNYATIVVRDFADPTLANRAIQTFYGGAASDLAGLTFSAGGNMLLGRYNDVLADVEAALQITESVPELYLMQGFAYCNLENYEAAENAYSKAVELDPEFALLYLLRSEAQLRQPNKLQAALADLEKARSYDLGAEFTALIEAGQTGNMSCKNFFDTVLETN